MGRGPGFPLADAQEFGMDAIFPASYGPFLYGFLTLCAAEILMGPRKLGHFSRVGVLLVGLLLLEMDVNRFYVFGLFAGGALMAVLSPSRTRRQLAGFLLQWLVPPLLVVLAFRFAVAAESLGPDAWVSGEIAVPVTFAMVALAARAVPSGKKLQWFGLWWSAGRLDCPPGMKAGDWRDRSRYARHPGQSAKRGMALWFTGWLGSILAMAGAVYAFYLTLKGHLFFFVLSFLAIFAYESFRKLPMKGRRHLIPVLKTTTDFRPGSYVLYLRPFDVDEERAGFSQNMYNRFGDHDVVGELALAVLSNRDEEEHIADVLRPVGPLLAIGGHDATVPHAGAMRMYLPMEAWRQPVRELMRRARLVVLTLGATPGTMWEYSEAMRMLPPERLLLLVPGSLSVEDYATIQRHSRETVSLPALGTNLDNNESISSIIRFSTDWQPSVTQVKKVTSPWQNLFTRLAPALRPSLEQLAAYERKDHRYSA